MASTVKRVSYYGKIGDSDAAKHWQNIEQLICSKRNASSKQNQQVTKNDQQEVTRKTQQSKTQKTPTPDQMGNNQKKHVSKLKQYHRKKKWRKRGPRYTSKVRRQLLTQQYSQDFHVSDLEEQIDDSVLNDEGAERHSPPGKLLKRRKPKQLSHRTYHSSGRILIKPGSHSNAGCSSESMDDESEKEDSSSRLFKSTSDKESLTKSQVQDNFSQTEMLCLQPAAHVCDNTSQSTGETLSQTEKVELRIPKEQHDSQVRHFASLVKYVICDMAGQQTSLEADVCKKINFGDCLTDSKNTVHRSCTPCRGERVSSDHRSFTHQLCDHRLCGGNCGTAHCHTGSTERLQYPESVRKAHHALNPPTQVISRGRCCLCHQDSTNMCANVHSKHSPLVCNNGQYIAACQTAAQQKNNAFEPSSTVIMKCCCDNSQHGRVDLPTGSPFGLLFDPVLTQRSEYGAPQANSTTAYPQAAHQKKTSSQFPLISSFEAITPSPTSTEASAARNFVSPATPQLSVTPPLGQHYYSRSALHQNQRYNSRTSAVVNHADINLPWHQAHFPIPRFTTPVPAVQGICAQPLDFSTPKMNTTNSGALPMLRNKQPGQSVLDTAATMPTQRFQGSKRPEPLYLVQTQKPQSKQHSSAAKGGLEESQNPSSGHGNNCVTASKGNNNKVSAPWSLPVKARQEKLHNCDLDIQHCSTSVGGGLCRAEPQDIATLPCAGETDHIIHQPSNNSVVMPNQDFIPSSSNSTLPIDKSSVNFASSNTYSQLMIGRGKDPGRYAWAITLQPDDEDLFASQNVKEINQRQEISTYTEMAGVSSLKSNKQRKEKQQFDPLPDNMIQEIINKSPSPPRDAPTRISPQMDESDCEVVFEDIDQSDLDHHQSGEKKNEQVDANPIEVHAEEGSPQFNKDQIEEEQLARTSGKMSEGEIHESPNAQEEEPKKMATVKDSQGKKRPRSSKTKDLKTNKKQKSKNKPSQVKSKAAQASTPIDQEKKHSSSSSSEGKLQSGESTSSKKQQDNAHNTKNMDESDCEMMFEELDPSEMAHIMLVLRQQELLLQKENGVSVTSPSDQRLLFRKLKAAQLPRELQALRVFCARKNWSSPPNCEKMSALKLLEQNLREKSQDPPEDEGIESPDKIVSKKKKYSPLATRMRPLPVCFLRKKGTPEEEPKASGVESNSKQNATQIPRSDETSPTGITDKKGKSRREAITGAKRKLDVHTEAGKEPSKDIGSKISTEGLESDSENVEKPLTNNERTLVSRKLSPPGSSVVLAKRTRNSSKARGKSNETRTLEKSSAITESLTPNAASVSATSLQIEESKGNDSRQNSPHDWTVQLTERQRKEKERWLNSQGEDSESSSDLSSPVSLSNESLQIILPLREKTDLVGNATVTEVALAHDIASCVILDDWRSVRSLKCTKRFLCPTYNKKAVVGELWDLRNHKDAEDVTNRIISLEWKNVHPVAFPTLISMFVSSLSRRSAYHMEMCNSPNVSSIRDSNSSTEENQTIRRISTPLVAVASRLILKGQWIEGMEGLLLEVNDADAKNLRKWCLPKFSCGQRWTILGPIAYLGQGKHANSRLCLKNAVQVFAQATCDIPIGQQIFTTYSSIEKNPAGGNLLLETSLCGAYPIDSIIA